MQIVDTGIQDVKIIQPQVYNDGRGFFFESFNQKKFQEVIGRSVSFVQDNHSKSIYGVLRGLHYQIYKPQGKLVRVVRGEVFDVTVDIRRTSPAYGQWVGEILSAENKKQLWVPEGFAHGFIVLSEEAELLYKTTDYYYPEHERCIAWDDKCLAIDWQFEGTPLVSQKDAQGLSFHEADVFK